MPISQSDDLSAEASAEADPLSFPFHVDVGQERIQLPRGFSNPQKVWLIDLRGRPVYISRMPKEDFDVAGRRYHMSDDGTPTHLLGMPMFYKIEDQQLYFWPVPAHAWQGVVLK